MISRDIKALPKDLADKIAAGEVVERPLSIVKELLENSIDAGASSVTVEIAKGGKELIRVSDNGCGIAKDQLNLAFKRYATSKIATEDDLNGIGTLGFRGEALASIASVSEVELITKQAGCRLGAKITLTAGDVERIEDAACEEGTTIVVRNLFFNTPARKKFLKPDNTEAALISDYVSKMAIAYPGVKIRMISNSSILFSTQGKGDLYSSIMTVYSPQIARNLIPVSIESSDKNLKLTGYISKPTESRSNRKWQIFFVNGRLVKNKVLEDALSAAYHDKMFAGHYPLAFLFLTTPADQLDVNIHPHKTEIRFFREADVFEFASKAVRAALLNPDALSYSGKAPKASTEIAKKTVISENVSPSDKSFIRPEVKPEIKSAFVSEPAKADKSAVPEVVSITEEPVFLPESRNTFPVSIEETAVKSEEQSFKDLRYEIELAETAVQEEIKIPEPVKAEESREFYFSKLSYSHQLDNSYLICKDEKNLYIIDQHAAHERVMYEKLRSSFDSEALASQTLLTPFVVELGKAQKLMFEDSMKLLSKLGFAAEDFGGGSVIVKEIPECLSLSEAEEFFKAAVSEAEEAGVRFRLKDDELITRACKSAVKANDVLSDEEVYRLFEELDKCENPFSCPHGRPSFVKFSVGDIERMFKRK